jgi:hypothetical protein
MVQPAKEWQRITHLCVCPLVRLSMNAAVCGTACGAVVQVYDSV